MFIILLRHGVAEDKSLPIPDSWRKLTAEGRQALIDFYPRFLNEVDRWLAAGQADGKLGPKDKAALVEVWTSPKKRAVETAKLLTEARAWPMAEALVSLATGDLHAFWTQLKARPELDLVIAAGHEPFFSRWVGMISGEQIQIAKGAAVALELDLFEDQLSGRVAWYLEPREKAKVKKEKFKTKSMLKKKKKKRNESTEPSSIKQRFELAYEAVLEAEERFLEKPEKVDRVHKLRVRTRALRALLSFYKPLLNLRNYHEIQGGLRESAQLLARLRELDVIIQQCQKQQNGAEASALLTFLEEERRREAELVYKLIEAGRLDELRQPFLRFLRMLNVADKPKFEAKRYKTWQKRVQADCRRLSDLRYPALHRLRIRVKKLRYVLEAIPMLRGEKYEAELEAVKQMQEELGLLCDKESNRELMEDLLQLELSSSVKDEILYYIRCLSQEDHHIME